jgi:hypothetical protein
LGLFEAFGWAMVPAVAHKENANDVTAFLCGVRAGGEKSEAEADHDGDYPFAQDR